MTDQNQNNISKLSVNLKNTISNHSIPHVSRVTKIERQYPLSEQQLQYKSTSFKKDTIIHTTVGMPKNDLRHITENLGVEKNNSLARIPHKQIMTRYLSLFSSNSRNIQETSLSPSKTQFQPQFNQWNNPHSYENIQKNSSFLPTQQYSNSRMTYLSSKLNKITDFDGMTRFKKEHPTILDEEKKLTKQNFFCKCSILCILLYLLIGLLLVGAIIGTIVGVLLRSKQSIMSTTLSTTTIIPTICSCLCSNGSWRFDSGYLARWPFDGTLNDLTNIYNVTSYNNLSFVSNGYVNQALLFNATLTQSLSTSYIPLAYTSFTIEVWLKPIFSSNLEDYSILGLCPETSPFQCLHVVIRKSGSSYHLYFGFYSNDCQGNTSLTSNQWIHAAFVFDITTLTQSVYLNGILDNSCTVSSPIIASVGSTTIGAVPLLIPIVNMNFYQGYMDHLTITQRAKSSCEVLVDATLAGCFLFDAASPYADSGPNSLFTSELSASIISSGPNNEADAISFNGTSYFQASSFTGLSLSNKSFSIALWIRPRSVLGIMVHVSTFSNGAGWCMPFLGIVANGSIVAQTYNSSNAVTTVWGPSIPMSPIWSHVVQTWSPSNGLRLYINGVLFASKAVNAYAASGVSNFVTLANNINGSLYCVGGALGTPAAGPLQCDMDDFRVYSRELTATDVATIYSS